MKMIVTYLPLLMLLWACGQEEELIVRETPKTGEILEVPFTLSIPSNTYNGLYGRNDTRAANDMYTDNNIPVPPTSGEADVDHVWLYIFKNTSNTENLEDFLWTETKTLEPTFENSNHTNTNTETDKTFTGKLSLDVSTSYRILAIAFNDRYMSNDDVEALNKIFQSEGRNLADTQIKLKELKEYRWNQKEFTRTSIERTGEDPDPDDPDSDDSDPDDSDSDNPDDLQGKLYSTEFRTPEFFVGYLYTDKQSHQESVTGYISNITKESLLTGQLYRGVGYVSIHLTNIPEDIEQLYLVSDLLARNISVYNNWYIQTIQAGNAALYPMGYAPKESSEGSWMLDTKQPSSNEVTLSSFLFPINTVDNSDGSISHPGNRMKFCIIVKKKNEEEHYSYPVECSSEAEIPTFGETSKVNEKLVEDNAFIVPINWKISIGGSYETLTQQASTNLLRATNALTVQVTSMKSVATGN